MSDSTLPTGASRRPLCPQCQRPPVRCLCPFITPVDNLIEVLILQHPLEAGHAKNSAQLLHLSLQRSQLHCGEQWDDARLAEWLAPPTPAEGDRNGDADSPHTVLLYPDTLWGDAPSRRFEPNLAGSPREHQDPRQPQWLRRLVVLDATWRKSRKMLHLNPRLQRLPRWSLPPGLPAQYQLHGVRKAHQPHQLSTLEACCHALMQLTPQTPTAPSLSALLDAFSRWLSTYPNPQHRPTAVQDPRAPELNAAKAAS